jgi:hypothetical protein
MSKESFIIRSQNADEVNKQIIDAEKDGWEVVSLAVGANAGYGSLVAVLLQREKTDNSNKTEVGKE